MESGNPSNGSLLVDMPYWNNDTLLFKPVFNIVISPMTIVVSVLGIAGNGLVVWYLSFKIKKTTSSIYIFNLAVADAAFLLFAFLLHIMALVFAMIPHLESQYEDEHVINLIGILTLACLFGYNTSLCLLTAISIERCLSVLFPIWYYCNRPRHMSSIVCTLIWTISSILCALEFAFCYSMTYNRKGILRESGRECKTIFIIICSFSLAFVPSMTVSSFILLLKVWTSSQHRRSKKLYVVIAVTVCFFLVFGMPMRVLLLIWYKHHAVPSFFIMDLFALFCCINSSINPFVYFLVGRQGQSEKITLLSIFQAVFRDDCSQSRREQTKATEEILIVNRKEHNNSTFQDERRLDVK
ncbi:proto-oncogene Mas-like [Hyla sarda]|uniref:proto-oncogene Mas-like n=1 Tax=Hyla sarda TaxID=327740 RepID=UPI0024C3050D|nr:proto-oncogene Mas-like [Hyla sarda]XP_056428551.1 proto-oncogene Mas-like [Hyla sarda]XP_056428552.1 proto-oncogene Mas-like [Hyla sarda]XP_056428553.1 proto-oncogene Mas-like [Hyla sarda]XP_056428554.1 proto-oncogene Mas-like [Hyla sarda]